MCLVCGEFKAKHEVFFLRITGTPGYSIKAIVCATCLPNKPKWVEDE